MPFSGGSGTAGDPYIVANTSDFLLINSYMNSYFKQTADIDFQEATINAIGWDNGSAQGAVFSGLYDGNGFSIKNAIINNANKDYMGLFRQCTSTMKNIFLKNVKVYGNSRVGCLVGNAANNPYVENCHTDADCEVHANSTSAGGLVGQLSANSYGTVMRVLKCSNKATVTSAGDKVGGIIGSCLYTTISNCYNAGNITGATFVGGLVGYFDLWSDAQSFKNYIEYCYNSGNISGVNYAGGIMGYSTGNNYGNAVRCFVTACSITRTSGISQNFGRISGHPRTGNNNNFASNLCSFVI